VSELFFFDRLERSTRGLAPDGRLAHPFLLGAIEGADNVRSSLRAAFAALDQELVPSVEFRGDGAAAVSWKCGPPDREIHGVTFALINAEGWVRELRIALRPVQFLTPWRETLRARLSGATGWEFPAASSGTLGPADSLPFTLSDNAVFYGPALVRGVEGGKAALQVIGHAMAAYGACEYYGSALRNGAHVLRAKTSKLPLEIVSIAHLDADGRVDELSVFMQPWPSMVLFLDRLRDRLAGYLDGSFFEVADCPSLSPGVAYGSGVQPVIGMTR
jgi:hypothetical protein